MIGRNNWHRLPGADMYSLSDKINELLADTRESYRKVMKIQSNVYRLECRGDISPEIGTEILNTEVQNNRPLPEDAFEKYFSNPEYLGLKKEIEDLKRELSDTQATLRALKGSKRHALKDVYYAVRDLIKILPFNIQSSKEVEALYKAIGDYRITSSPTDAGFDADAKMDMEREAAGNTFPKYGEL